MIKGLLMELATNLLWSSKKIRMAKSLERILLTGTKYSMRMATLFKTNLMAHLEEGFILMETSFKVGSEIQAHIFTAMEKSLAL